MVVIIGCREFDFFFIRVFIQLLMQFVKNSSFINNKDILIVFKIKEQKFSFFYCIILGPQLEKLVH